MKPQVYDPEVFPIDCIYAAGFVDGEAWLGITMGDHKKAKSPIFDCQITIANTSLPVLEWFKERWGGSICQRLHRKWKPCYLLQIRSKEAVRLCNDLLPYLKVKKEQARLLTQLDSRLRAGITVGRGKGGVGWI